MYKLSPLPALCIGGLLVAILSKIKATTLVAMLREDPPWHDRIQAIESAGIHALSIHYSRRDNTSFIFHYETEFQTFGSVAATRVTRE